MLQITNQSTASEIAAQMSILMRGTACGSKNSLITLSQLTSSGAREHTICKADDLLSVAPLKPTLYLSNLVSVVLIIYAFECDFSQSEQAHLFIHHLYNHFTLNAFKQ